MKVDLTMGTGPGTTAYYRVELATTIESFLPGIRARSLMKWDQYLDQVYGPEITSGHFEEGQHYRVYRVDRPAVTDKLLMKMVERQAQSSSHR